MSEKVDAESPLMSSMDGDSATVVRRLLEVLFPDAHTILDPTFGNGRFWPSVNRRRCASRSSTGRGAELRTPSVQE